MSRYKTVGLRLNFLPICLYLFIYLTSHSNGNVCNFGNHTIEKGSRLITIYATLCEAHKYCKEMNGIPMSAGSDAAEQEFMAVTKNCQNQSVLVLKIVGGICRTWTNTGGEYPLEKRVNCNDSYFFMCSIDNFGCNTSSNMTCDLDEICTGCPGEYNFQKNCDCAVDSSSTEIGETLPECTTTATTPTTSTTSTTTTTTTPSTTTPSPTAAPVSNCTRLNGNVFLVVFTMILSSF